MMEKDWRELFHDGELAVLTLLRWVVIGGLTGLACGLAGGAFSRVLSWVTQTRQANPWLIFCMPVAGLLIVWSYQALDMANDSGTNQIIASVRSGERPRLRLALLIFFSAALTHLTGGSAGREGAALQIGGSLAAALGKWLRLNERNMNLIVLCGMSALFTALFGTPVAATVFSLEVVSVGILHYSALFPGLFASLVSLGVTRWMGLRGEGWTLLGMPELSPLAVLQVGGLAIACALVAILFCVVMHGSARLYQRVLPNPYLRVLAGAALVILLTVLEGSGTYNGAGSAFLNRVLAGGRADPWAFLLKMAFTALTLGAGFRGGEIVPTFFVGATFGCLMGQILHISPSLAAACGMAAVFCGVTNSPISSLLISLEMFGFEGAPFYFVAIAISYMQSGYYGLYRSQKIMYSKVKTQFINRNAKE